MSNMTKNSETYILWGSNPSYVNGELLKLAIGSLRDCRAEAAYRERIGGWLLGTYRQGDEPVGLQMRAASRCGGCS